MDGEIAGGAVEGVGGDVCGKQAHGEAARLELAVGGARDRVRVLGEGAGGREEEEDGEGDEEEFRHFGRIFLGFGKIS